jgi:hypothetical protein
MENTLNTLSFNSRLIGSSVLLAAAIVLGAALPALADTSTVTQVLTSGSLSASATSLALPSVVATNFVQTPAGSLTLTADDSRGGAGGLGWSVSIQSSAFAYAGPVGGTDIPADNLILVTPATPAMTAGQAYDATGGPNVPPTLATGPLGTARKVMTTTAAFGQGTYTQLLGVTLTVPASSKVGTYTGTLTTSISTTP